MSSQDINQTSSAPMMIPAQGAATCTCILSNGQDILASAGREKDTKVIFLKLRDLVETCARYQKTHEVGNLNQLVRELIAEVESILPTESDDSEGMESTIFEKIYERIENLYRRGFPVVDPVIQEIIIPNSNQGLCAPALTATRPDGTEIPVRQVVTERHRVRGMEVLEDGRTHELSIISDDASHPQSLRPIIDFTPDSATVARPPVPFVDNHPKLKRKATHTFLKVKSPSLSVPEDVTKINPASSTRVPDSGLSVRGRESGASSSKQPEPLVQDTTLSSSSNGVIGTSSTELSTKKEVMVVIKENRVLSSVPSTPSVVDKEVSSTLKAEGVVHSSDTKKRPHNEDGNEKENDVQVQNKCRKKSDRFTEPSEPTRRSSRIRKMS